MGIRLENVGIAVSDPATYAQRLFELSVAPYFHDPALARDLTPFRVTGRTQQEVWASLGDFDLRERLARPHGEEVAVAELADGDLIAAGQSTDFDTQQDDH